MLAAWPISPICAQINPLEPSPQRMPSTNEKDSVKNAQGLQSLSKISVEEAHKAVERFSKEMKPYQDIINKNRRITRIIGLTKKAQLLPLIVSLGGFTLTIQNSVVFEKGIFLNTWLTPHLPNPEERKFVSAVLQSVLVNYPLYKVSQFAIKQLSKHAHQDSLEKQSLQELKKRATGAVITQTIIPAIYAYKPTISFLCNYQEKSDIENMYNSSILLVNNATSPLLFKKVIATLCNQSYENIKALKFIPDARAKQGIYTALPNRGVRGDTHVIMHDRGIFNFFTRLETGLAQQYANIWQSKISILEKIREGALPSGVAQVIDSFLKQRPVLPPLPPLLTNRLTT